MLQKTRIGKKKAVDLITTKKIETMKQTFYPHTFEQEIFMDIVYKEQQLRGQSPDNYNTQELAYRQAISDGAMRGDNYFAT